MFMGFFLKNAKLREKSFQKIDFFLIFLAKVILSISIKKGDKMTYKHKNTILPQGINNLLSKEMALWHCRKGKKWFDTGKTMTLYN